MNGQHEYGDVGADVDDAGDIKEGAEIDACPRCRPVPDLTSRSTFEDLDQRDCDVEEGVEVDEQLYKEVGGAPPAWGEELRVE